ncbi:hypothetical protein ACP4OV_027047 [Aristida adscensionis]
MERTPEMAVRCLIVLVLAATFTISSGQLAASGKSPADQFLHTQCNTTDLATDCYAALAPFAESYGGSRTKVAVGATTILLAKLETFLAELHGVNIKEPGKYKLEPCVKMVEAAVSEKRERLAKIKELENIGDGKLTEKDLAELTKWLTEASKSYRNACFDTVQAIPKGDELLPSDEGVDNFLEISVSLVKGLTGGAAAPVSQ